MPVVDIAIPVYNEERDLEPNLRRLRAYLDARFPFAARITIVDNASTDRTWDIARALALELPGVRAQRLREKGRGRPVRHAWLGSDASVVAYMDIDLSTDLDALLPLIAPLVSGHSDVAIGSRLAPGARVARGFKREVISRTYNLLLHVVLGARVRDAQCGFKAVRADAARRLLPEVADEAWFFDTELLVRAQRAGMRIHEVPVDWTDDPDSRVDLIPTAIEDLRGVWRLSDQLRSFLVIGVLSTLAYIACYAAFRLALPATLANALSQLLTALGNTAANRRFTFDGSGNGVAAPDHLRGPSAIGLSPRPPTAPVAAPHPAPPPPPPPPQPAAPGVANPMATA